MPDELIEAAIAEATKLLADGNFDETIALLRSANLTADDLLDPVESSRTRFAPSSKAVRTSDLIRQVEFRAAEVDDGSTLEGYAAVFNQPALIDNYEGKFREQMMPGAFTKTISERMPVLMFNHGKHPMISEIPIGKISVLREDAHGLYFSARLSDNWLVEPVRDAVKEGAVTGVSVRMKVAKDVWTPGADRIQTRSIHAVDLYELGPVVFPAYSGTSVGVRAQSVLDGLCDPEVRAEVARIFQEAGSGSAHFT